MNIILNTVKNDQTEKLLPGRYSRSLNSGARQTRLCINFLEKGEIELSPESAWLGIQTKNLHYKSFGHVLRIFEEGENREVSYYSFFYSNGALHLSSLMDDSHPRRTVLNGKWKVEER